MAYVPVPKDLTKVKTKVAFNLTKRQLVCFGGGALLGVPLFFLLRGSAGNSTAALCMMFVMLPSGRRLVYVKPKMGLNRFGNESVTYEGVGEQKKWLRLESYGPKFVENIVQATARDILAEAMLRLNAAGYRIVMHVHDEAVIEAPPDTSLENICSVMGQTPTWASGLLLRADGYVCDFYKKD